MDGLTQGSDGPGLTGRFGSYGRALSQAFSKLAA